VRLKFAYSGNTTLNGTTPQAFCAPKVCTFIQPSLRASGKENSKMTDDVQKNQGQNPGQSGQQSGQQQQKNPQDVSKKDPSQDRNKEHDDQQGQRDQGGQRRAS
jgi:hypothetical protein